MGVVGWTGVLVGGGGRGGGILSSSVSIRLNLLLNFDCFFGIQHLILFTFFIKGISIHPFYRRAGPPPLKNSCARQWLAMPLFGFRLIIDHFVLLTLWKSDLKKQFLIRQRLVFSLKNPN